LIGAWLAIGVVLRRWCGAGDVGVKRARTTEPWMNWTGTALASGWANPLRAGCAEIARTGFSDQGRYGRSQPERQKGVTTMLCSLSAPICRAVWDDD